jgi:hypothetical protein
VLHGDVGGDGATVLDDEVVPIRARGVAQVDIAGAVVTSLDGL